MDGSAQRTDKRIHRRSGTVAVQKGGSRRGESNPGPLAYEASALAIFASEASGAVDHRQQIYARQISGQLRLLRLCARMQADELESLGVSEVARDHLNQAVEDFDTGIPDAMAARNMLEHFDDYARGLRERCPQGAFSLQIDTSFPGHCLRRAAITALVPQKSAILIGGLRSG